MNRYRNILLKDEAVDLIGLGLSDISSFSGEKACGRRKLAYPNQQSSILNEMGGGDISSFSRENRLGQKEILMK